MAKHNVDADVANCIAGLHAVTAALLHQPQHIAHLLINRERKDARMQHCLDLAQQQNVPCDYLSKKAFMAEAQRYSGAHTQGILAICHSSVPSTPIATLDALLPALRTQKALLLVLDGIQDPHNLGACVRTANAAGAQAVIIPQDRSASLTATARKAASGAAEVTPVITVTNLARALQALKDEGIWLYGLAAEATTSLYKIDLTYPSALLLGAEGSGLRRLTREYCDELVTIPMGGSVGSLNVSVAAGVGLFEALRQRRYKT